MARMKTFKQFLSEDTLNDLHIQLAVRKLLPKLSKSDAVEVSDWLQAVAKLSDEDQEGAALAIFQEVPNWEDPEARYSKELRGMTPVEYGPPLFKLLKKDLKDRYNVDVSDA